MIPKPGTAFAVPDGDPSRHLSLAELERGLLAMRPAPRDQGTVQHLFARPGSNERVALERATLTVTGGMPGDRWSLGREGKPPKPDQQLSTMQVDVARLVANGQPTALFGDNLFLDLDLSSGNLPVGTRLRVGTALLAVTPEEHNGCLKFKARFGADALRLVARKETRARNLRGIYLGVIEEGEVAAGDPVEVLREER